MYKLDSIRQKELDTILSETIIKKMSQDENLKKNLCPSCYGKNIDIYFQDTGDCNKCGKRTDVLNPLIYETLTSQGFTARECYGNVPRIYNIFIIEAIEKFKKEKNIGV